MKFMRKKYSPRNAVSGESEQGLQLVIVKLCHEQHDQELDVFCSEGLDGFSVVSIYGPIIIQWDGRRGGKISHQP